MFGRKKIEEPMAETPAAPGAAPVPQPAIAATKDDGPVQTVKPAIQASPTPPQPAATAPISAIAKGAAEAAKPTVQPSAVQSEQAVPTLASGGVETPGAVEPTELSDELKQVMGPKLLAAAFGEVMSVFMRSPGHKFYSIADMEWMVVPALLTNQFSVASARTGENGVHSVPVGVAFWAKVSTEVDQRLSTNLNSPIKMRPDEWQSGDIFWLIDVAAPQDVAHGLIDNLRHTAFAGKDVKIRIMDEKGQRSVKLLKGVSESIAPSADTFGISA